MRKLIHIIITSIVFLTGVFTCSVNGQFVVRDVLICSANANILDPEYNTILNKVCWQSENDELWVCDIDPITHEFVPLNGKGTLIDDSLRPFVTTGWNGPEWMLSNNKTSIVYCKKSGTSYKPAMATQQINGWNIQILPYSHALYMMGSSNVNDTLGYFLFERMGVNGIYFGNNQDYNIKHYPHASLGFFAHDDPIICCVSTQNRKPGYISDLNTNFYFQTINDDVAGGPSMWHDPHTGKRMYCYRAGNFKQLRILIETSLGEWSVYHTIPSPLPEYPYVTSPEPFVFANKSFVSFMASETPFGAQGPLSRVFVSSVYVNDTVLRQVSSPNVAYCIDPEPVIFPDSAFVFYTEKYIGFSGDERVRVRKCNTGLELLLNNNPIITKNEPLKITPNPSNGVVKIVLPTKSNALQGRLEILDYNGVKVWSDGCVNIPLTLDVSFLSQGIYIIHFKSENAFYTGKMLLSK